MPKDLDGDEIGAPFSGRRVPLVRIPVQEPLGGVDWPIPQAVFREPVYDADGDA